LDEEAWAKTYDMISSSLMKVTDAGDTFIKGTVNAPNGGILVTSVPYEEGWSMKIDGMETEITELTGDAWISAQLDPGTHEVELNFRPAGFIKGLILTIESIIILLVATLLPAVLRRRRSQTAESDCNTE
jgi:uncharacterized membrane protein YfhO